MLRSLYTAATGMIAQQTGIDVTTNNIANVNTCLLYTSPSPRD
jgi:flagellar basal-body rod protein FlgG